MHDLRYINHHDRIEKEFVTRNKATKRILIVYLQRVVIKHHEYGSQP